jgi:hypothetical protein
MGSKQLLKSLGMLASLLVILACGLASTPAPQVGSLGTVVSATLQALTAAVPASTQAAQSIGIPVSFQNVSFVIPGGLALSASSKVIPNNPTDQTGGPWAVAPQHLEFTLNGYNLPPGYFQQILIDIYPAQEYAKVYDGANISLQHLQAFLASPAMPISSDTLPQVPYFNAAAMFNAQVKVVHFKNGTGVGMVTQYGQAVGPIVNSGTFYNFEGLTSDGKYFLVVVLPVEAPFLLNGNDPSAPLPAGGIPFPDYNSKDAKVFDNYYKAITDKMNATDANSFQPSLNSLDALVQSINISQ